MRLKVKQQSTLSLDIEKFNPQTTVSIDTETLGVDVFGSHVPFMVAMCDEQGNTLCFNWPVNPFTREVTVNQADVKFINTFTGSDKYTKVYHNSKFDVRMLAKIGIVNRGRIDDTLFKARVCYSLELDYGLKYLSRTRLGVPDQDEKDLQDAVNVARRKMRSYNTRAEQDDEPLMLMSSESKEDYWLPHFFDPDNNLCEKYCRLDVYRTMGLSMFYDDILDKDLILKATYEREMTKIWPIVNTMEERGMKIFPKAVKEESKVCRDAMERHFANMLTIIKDSNLFPFPVEKTTPPIPTGRTRKEWKAPEFNPGSPQQLLRVLYLPEGEGGLGIKTDKVQRKTGKPTTDKDTLRELMYIPFVRELAGYRAAKHTMDLFFDKFTILSKPDPIDKGGFCVHPGLNQCGTKTGRFSCVSPNLQQVSSGGKKSLSASYNGAKVFGPREGYVWLDFDYSQQEGRIFAFLAQVPVMLDALASGTDLFEAMANQAWGGKGNPKAFSAAVQALDLTKASDNPHVLEWQKKTGIDHEWINVWGLDSAEIAVDEWLAEFDYNIVAAEESLDKSASRQRTKHITYAKIFGGGPGSFTHLLYCSLEEAKVFDAEYNASMPEMKQFMKRVETEAKRDGFVLNLYQRKLRVDPDFAYRGVSYMIQGSAADQMKESLIKVDSFLKSTKVDAHLLLTIHDALRIEIKASQLNNGFVRAIKSRMEDTEGRITIPMPVDATLVKERWGVNEKKIKL